MTRTFRRRDSKEPVRDGKCWRGCGGSCNYCRDDRTNKKVRDQILYLPELKWMVNR